MPDDTLLKLEGHVDAGFSASVAAMERIASGGISYALADIRSRLPFLEVWPWLRRCQTNIQQNILVSTSNSRLDARLDWHQKNRSALRQHVSFGIQQDSSVIGHHFAQGLLPFTSKLPEGATAALADRMRQVRHVYP